MNHSSSPESESRPYFLDIFDILPRCASTIRRPPRLLWMHPQYEKGLTWDATRIELLWDSIFRGVPIGSFTTCGDTRPARPLRLYDDLLLDGEQRCLAIALGMHDPDLDNPAHDPDIMLWIDLEPDIFPHSDREFLIRLTTADHPWGFGKSDDCPPRAPVLMRESISKIGLDPDDAGSTNKRPRPRELFPHQASAPIPLGWLLNEKGKAFEPFWETIEERVMASRLVTLDSLVEFLSNRSSAAEVTRQKIYAAITSLTRYRIICSILSDSAPPAENF